MQIHHLIMIIVLKVMTPSGKTDAHLRAYFTYLADQMNSLENGTVVPSTGLPFWLLDGYGSKVGVAFIILKRTTLRNKYEVHIYISYCCY